MNLNGRKTQEIHHSLEPPLIKTNELLTKLSDFFLIFVIGSSIIKLKVIIYGQRRRFS